MPVYTFGNTEIKFNGTKIGMAYKDTVSINPGTTERTEHYEEGKANPAILNKKRNAPTFTFSIMNPDLEFLADHLGGTVDASGSDPVWKFDPDAVIAPGKFEFIAKNGINFTINKGDIDANIGGNLNDTDLLLVNFVVTPLIPDEAGEAAIEGSIGTDAYSTP